MITLCNVQGWGPFVKSLEKRAWYHEQKKKKFALTVTRSPSLRSSLEESSSFDLGIVNKCGKKEREREKDQCKSQMKEKMKRESRESVCVCVCVCVHENSTFFPTRVV